MGGSRGGGVILHIDNAISLSLVAIHDINMLMFSNRKSKIVALLGFEPTTSWFSGTVASLVP